MAITHWMDRNVVGGPAPDPGIGHGPSMTLGNPRGNQKQMSLFNAVNPKYAQEYNRKQAAKDEKPNKGAGTQFRRK